MTTPLESLKSAETALVRQIHAVANVVRNTATLQHEVEACGQRLTVATQAMLDLTTGLAAFVGGLVADDAVGVVALEMAGIPHQINQDATSSAKLTPESTYTDADLDADLKRLAKRKGFAPLTAAEAEKAYNEATPEPIGEDRIKEIVEFATSSDRQAEESTPATSDGAPYYDSTGEVLLGVGTGAEAIPSLPDEPTPGKNGKHQKAKKRK